MPCRDGGPSQKDIEEENARIKAREERADVVTRFLCALLTKKPTLAKQVSGLAEWWRMHKAVDTARLREEMEARNRTRQHRGRRINELRNELDALLREQSADAEEERTT